MAAEYGRHLNGVEYKNLDGLTRSIHFSELRQCYKRQELVPSKLTSKVVNTSGVGEVLWFGPRIDPAEHNRYGNVSFSLSMKEVVDRFGKQIYYIDRLYFRTHTSTRLLLTSSTYRHLRKVNLDRNGSPVLHKRWIHAVSHRTDCDMCHGVYPHEVEIAIEVEWDDCSWLYRNCHVEANNHSWANSKTNGRYDKDVCFLYNTVGNERCPHAYTKLGAQAYLAKKVPGSLLA